MSSVVLLKKTTKNRKNNPIIYENKYSKSCVYISNIKVNLLVMGNSISNDQNSVIKHQNHVKQWLHFITNIQGDL